MTTIYLITGPTASGKSEYAVKLAKRLGSTSRRRVGIKSEIISADSRQVYKGMTIGSGAPPLKRGYWKGVRHHLIGAVEPTKIYTAFDFQHDANKLIKHIQKRGHTPIIVGGTGLWIRSLKEVLDFRGAKHDVKLRRRLEKELEKKGLLYLVEKLKKILRRHPVLDTGSRNKKQKRKGLFVFDVCFLDSRPKPGMTNIDYHNPRRVIRALEILLSDKKKYRSSGVENYIKETSRQARRINNIQFKTIHLSPSKEVLYKRINKRVDEMVKEGLVKEVMKLLKIYTIGKPTSQRHPELAVPRSEPQGSTTRDSGSRQKKKKRKVTHPRFPSREGNQRGVFLDSGSKAGMTEEVWKINESKLKKYPALTGIGYREMIDYLQEKVTLPGAVNLIKLHTRQYAKRQITWFKKYH